MEHQHRHYPLVESEAPSEPEPLFRKWLSDCQNSNLALPMVANLATATLPEGSVSSRQVQVVELDKRGTFLVYSNWGESKKGVAVRSNENVSLCFYWREFNRSVRIEGTGVRMTEEEDDDYFQTRPREYQVSVVAFHQDEVVPDRQELEQRIRTVKITSEDSLLHPPPTWGGLRIIPKTYEFWQGREDLIHDRLLYEINGTKWKRKRLSP